MTNRVPGTVMGHDGAAAPAVVVHAEGAGLALEARLAALAAENLALKAEIVNLRLGRRPRKKP